MIERERIIYDGKDDCPYLPDRISCTPLRYQFIKPSPSEFDDSLSMGDRRVGSMLYRTKCPECIACEPIRVPVQEFAPSKSLRRILKKNVEITVQMGQAIFSTQRLDMYNRHKQERGLSQDEAKIMQRAGYENWFLRSCTDTREFRYYLNDVLIGISILDFGEQDISSVYFFFDPDYSHLSLGTFSALFEILWMKSQQMRYYYLGLYVEDCSHLSYKSRYFPHERKVKDDWHRFQNKKVTRVEAPKVEKS
jgi:leucyl-tRNA---protein transferase